MTPASRLAELLSRLTLAVTGFMIATPVAIARAHQVVANALGLATYEQMLDLRRHVNELEQALREEIDEVDDKADDCDRRLNDMPEPSDVVADQDLSRVDERVDEVAGDLCDLTDVVDELTEALNEARAKAGLSPIGEQAPPKVMTS